jgi:BirA family transcriptional regulator, biotin operon repressor / biotin---[acetyl-CoA-carboxylase] ligase
MDIRVIQHCESTNTYLQDLQRSQAVDEGFVVFARQQTAGRGQRGAAWESRAGQNLTASLLLRPNFLSPQRVFWLNIVVSLGILEALQQLTGLPFQIKWANDIFINDKKIAGILIENQMSQDQIETSIVGIGLNVNQLDFQEPKAVSLAMLTQKNYDIEVICRALVQGILGKYRQLAAAQDELLRSRYLQNLYRYQEWHLFEIAGKKVAGQILGINAEGKLALETDNTIRYFGLKEIKFL